MPAPVLGIVPPIDRMANLNIEPGTQSFDQIIGNIESGVYMESNRSWSIDDYRLKFQFGCEYAKLIENGRLTRTLRNPNYRGRTPEFWQNLIAVGDPSTFGIFGTPFCGKGEPNQAIRVGHASPVCAFAKYPSLWWRLVNGRGQTSKLTLGETPATFLSVVRLPFRHSPSDFLLYHALGS